MIELFREAPPIERGTLLPPTWPFIRRGLALNLQRVKAFHYRHHPTAVKSNHLLIRILQSIAVDKVNHDTNRYYQLIEPIALNVSMAHKLTSSIYKGRLFRGVFYGQTTPEVIIAIDEPFDPVWVHENWAQVSAVKPLLHPKTDLDLHIPDGQDYSQEDGLCVIAINIAMLAMQYRAFRLIQNRSTDSPKSINQFIAGYVLPNMLDAHLDLAIANRVFAAHLSDTRYKNTVFRKHSFSLSNYTPHVDLAIERTLDNIRKSSKDFQTIQQSIPAVTANSALEALLMPDIMPAMQVNWAALVARLRALYALSSLAGDQLTAKNRHNLNQFLRSLRAGNAFEVLTDQLPPECTFEADFYVEWLLEAMGVSSY